jgi:hypothetical protein
MLQTLPSLCMSCVEALGISVQNHGMNQPVEQRQASCVSELGSSTLIGCYYTQLI